MKIKEVIRMALRVLARNKMRTLLTMLGIVIGVAAVICVIGVGTSASDQVQGQIQSLGENMLFIQAGSVNTGGFQMGTGANKTLLVSDAEAIARDITAITSVSPEADTNAQIVYADQNWAVRDQGVGTRLLRNSQLADRARGGFLTAGCRYSSGCLRHRLDCCEQALRRGRCRR